MKRQNIINWWTCKESIQPDSKCLAEKIVYLRFLNSVFSTENIGKCALILSVSGSLDFSLNTCLNNISWIQYRTGSSSGMAQ